MIAHWNRGVANVPHTTGAAAVMDCGDLIDACTRLDIALPLAGFVLDVGCGTGRWRAQCEQYVGCDISADACAYAQQAGAIVRLITGPVDLPIGPFDWICCFSVFTHISRADRVDYLRAFATRGTRLIVDVIPGPEGGGVALWRADWSGFLDDLEATGWAVGGVYQRVSPDGQPHRYVSARRVA